MVAMSTPAWSRCIAVVWRTTCGDTRLAARLGTSLASSPAGLIEQVGDALPRQAVAARVAERIVGRGFERIVI